MKIIGRNAVVWIKTKNYIIINKNKIVLKYAENVIVNSSCNNQAISVRRTEELFFWRFVPRILSGKKADFPIFF
jgi:hypothetical protein